MADRAPYPAAAVDAGHVEPAPRRVRGVLAGQVVLDTDAALYAWHWSRYPVYVVPADDVAPGALVTAGATRHDRFGAYEVHDVVVGATTRPGAARVRAEGVLAGTVQVDFAALDEWWEEDERIFVHARDPYVRVDALRCERPVRVEVDGRVLAEAASCVRVFETALPPRHYLPARSVDWAQLVASDTVTECPYKGTTSGYWSVRDGGEALVDVAWRYDFPTRQLLPIAGMVAFYDERVDTWLGGRLLPRPRTHFSPASGGAPGSA